jgi:hypothetical protein
VAGVLALPLEEHVGLADGVGLGVDLLAVEVGLDGAAVGGSEVLEGFLGDGEHAARAAGAVVKGVGAGPDVVGDGQEDEVGHEADGVAGRPVLAGLLVILLVELADQLFEDRAHGVVVEGGLPDGAVAVRDRGRAEVDVGVEELRDEGAERVGLGEGGELVAELEVLQDVLDVL